MRERMHLGLSVPVQLICRVFASRIRRAAPGLSLGFAPHSGVFVLAGRKGLAGLSLALYAVFINPLTARSQGLM